MVRASFGRRLFVVLNYLFLAATAAACLLPLVNVLAISFSSSSAVAAGQVTLWPVDFSLKSYEFVIGKPEFGNAFLISVLRVAVGMPLNMLLTILIAYPLSKDRKHFRFRNAYAWYFVLTMLFSGGLIPWFMTIKMTGILDTFWALILPSAVPVFNVILLLNFFKSLPDEIEEAAEIDGASRWQALWRIAVPLSAPAIATLTLFCIVTHWNSWFEGLILMNRPEHYPLQSYLQTVIVGRDMALMTAADVARWAEISDRTSKAAQVFVAMLPVLLVYPFLQKHFAEGIVMGSVKG
ncbi:ABC transporter permease [Cohnella sp. CIP 111063]|uniref:carbohydrate ABC transporter permease n=1 Tax=unclassified Cohnella TaxID=2636738 RepID=UPI000B8BC1C2|nr:MULTISPECIES: carbohydrate ABC transporter permease [unclassified Cohnella]OXS55291.1 ABC transporter permease [Cohnella sp. CIP 111063]PRX65718.1 putative aldouronate transport system permease protein [Cohnella sp. SGD-V74]